MTQRLNPYRVREPFYGTTVSEIRVPSGKLIAADDLRGVPYFDVEADNSINYGAGLDEWSRKFAEVAGVAQAFVGNSSPVVTRQKDGALVVVSPDYDEETDERVLENGEEVVADICTDLWSTMLTDYDHWVIQGGPVVEDLNKGYALEKFTVFDVTPGVYRWTVYSNDDNFDIHGYGRTEYARLELIEAFDNSPEGE